MEDKPNSRVDQHVNNLTGRNAIQSNGAPLTWKYASFGADIPIQEPKPRRPTMAVSKEDFDRFIAAYPRPLSVDVDQITDPPLVTYNDFSDGKIWPESIVAGFKSDDLRGLGDYGHFILAGGREQTPPAKGSCN